MNNCWLCGSKSSPMPEVGEKVYYHCPVCDLIFIDDKYILSPEEEMKRYTLHNNTPDNEGYVKFLSNFINEALEPFIKNCQTGLDFGCGPGPVLSDLITKLGGVKMDYYDPYFYSNIDFSNKRYDLITATEVLEHVRKPGEVLQFFKNHLSSGGTLAVMTLFHHNYDFKIWWYKRDPTHICFYSPITFKWIAEHFSLHIKYINDNNICVMRNVSSMHI
ncbi:MAG: class I SAM-dependent methyltransferase [Firmicutes bacterium]|nr:class I SAM-dependent methyltransferase [Bacillota bacterium]